LFINIAAYGAYLIFQLWSHAKLYDDDADGTFKSTPFSSTQHKSSHGSSSGSSTGIRKIGSAVSSISDKEDNSLNPPLPANNERDLEQQAEAAAEEEEEDEEKEAEEVPQLSLWMAITTLAVVTVVRHVRD
jgi:Ca2+/H+ antiporter